LIYKDTPAHLDGSTAATIHFWSPSTYLDDHRALYTRAELPKTEVYVLSVEDDFGCRNSDTVMIIVEVNTLLMLPTGFSPNADGINDVFRIVRHLNIQKLKEFSVFNRWGEKLFSTTDISEGWDGTYQNKEQGIGVYVWQVVAQTKDSEEIVRKGNVTLVR
jgi:gliding motility-associated-like protein